MRTFGFLGSRTSAAVAIPASASARRINAFENIVVDSKAEE